MISQPPINMITEMYCFFQFYVDKCKITQAQEGNNGFFCRNISSYESISSEL